MKFQSPSTGALFTIGSDAVWPRIVFQTDASGPHNWEWTIQWGIFRKTGVADTPGNSWDVGPAVADAGGTLTVIASAGGTKASSTVKITGSNPTSAAVMAYLASKPGTEGFDKILQHESKFRHFNASGEPLKSFDNGYGMCQLTDARSHLRAGVALAAKSRWRFGAVRGQGCGGDQLPIAKRAHLHAGTVEVRSGVPLERRRISRVGPCEECMGRNPKILCDAATGNIGWDITDPENAGKTAQELHKRDSGSYSKPPGAGAHWKYSGICYADAILG